MICIDILEHFVYSQLEEDESKFLQQDGVRAPFRNF
jgi:hypothetical protein